MGFIWSWYQIGTYILYQRIWLNFSFCGLSKDWLIGDWFSVLEWNLFGILKIGFIGRFISNPSHSLALPFHFVLYAASSDLTLSHLCLKSTVASPLSVWSQVHLTPSMVWPLPVLSTSYPCVLLNQTICLFMTQFNHFTCII